MLDDSDVSAKTPITVAYGDGIGPGIMEASLHIIQESGAQPDLETEKIVRFGFEYARQNGRKKVTCLTKDNIMKMTDGLFHKIFDEIAAEYPEIEKEHWIVDTGAAKLADTPNAFDVIIMPNLYGNILSDVAAQIAGSVGLAGSANVGITASTFEAIHGSAPRRAGQNLANPSGLLLGGVIMLVHIGQWEAAQRVHNACLKRLEDAVHTYDIFEASVSKEKVGTKEFAAAVVVRMGQKPAKLTAADYSGAASQRKEWVPNPARKLEKIELVGVDLYTGSNYRCRYENGGQPVTQGQIAALDRKIIATGFDIVKTETLRTFDGQQGFTLAQGQ